jgi:hypothetical protein
MLMPQACEDFNTLCTHSLRLVSISCDAQVTAIGLQCPVQLQVLALTHPLGLPILEHTRHPQVSFRLLTKLPTQATPCNLPD